MVDRGDESRSIDFDTRVVGSEARLRATDSLASAAAVYAGDKSCAATSDDYMFGLHVKRSWMALVEGGSLQSTDGWCRFKNGEECSTVLELTGPRAVRGLKTEVCAWWEGHGIGRNWWWIN